MIAKRILLIRFIYWGFYLLIFLLYLPLVQIIIASFNKNPSIIKFTEFTTKNYFVFLKDNELMEATINSFIIALIAGLISTALGFLVALYHKDHYNSLTKLIAIILILPIITPDIILGISSRSFFNLIGLERGYFSTILAHTVFGIAFSYLIISRRFDQMKLKMRNLEQAAMDLGASPYQIITKIILPNPSVKVLILGVYSICFILSFDDYLVAFFNVKNDTIPIFLTSTFRRHFITTNTAKLASVITIMSLLLLFIASKFESKKEDY